MQVQSYLFFDGRAEEGIEFYKKALGAEVTMLMRFKDSPDQSMRILRAVVCTVLSSTAPRLRMP